MDATSESIATVSCVLVSGMEIQELAWLASKVSDEVYPGVPTGYQAVFSRLSDELCSVNLDNQSAEVRWLMEGEKVIRLETLRANKAAGV